MAKKGTLQVTRFAAGTKGTEVVFPEERAVLAVTQSITFLISTEMEKSTKHFLKVSFAVLLPSQLCSL